MWFDYTEPELVAAWKENCLHALRNGCDGCFIDNSQHMGSYLKINNAKYGAGTDKVRPALTKLRMRSISNCNFHLL